MNKNLRSQISNLKFAACLAAMIAFAAPAAIAAVNTNAGIIFPEITNGAGARAAGMAGAFTAVADDASAAFWNPAGLSGVKSMSAGLSYETVIMDSSMNNLLAALPLGPGALGLNLFYMNFGSFANVGDDSVELDGSISPFTLSADIAYGLDLGMLSAGAGIKIMNQSRGEDSDTGFAADVGLGISAGIFKAALSGRNLGAAGSFSLPMEARLGLAVEPELGGDLGVIVAADAGYVFNDSFYAMAGLEIKAMKILFLRAGYRYRAGGSGLTGFSGITAGAGLKLGMFGINYAFIPMGELGISHRMELCFEWESNAKPDGKKDAEEVVKKQQPVDLTNEEEKMYKMFFEAGTLENSGKLAEAAVIYRKMIKTDPSYAPAYKRLGAVFVKQGKKPEAVWCFEKYLKLKPDDAAVVKWLNKNK